MNFSSALETHAWLLMKLPWNLHDDFDGTFPWGYPWLIHECFPWVDDEVFTSSPSSSHGLLVSNSGLLKRFLGKSHGVSELHIKVILWVSPEPRVSSPLA